ncbi:MAG: hypothetical protein LBD51_06430, partial [Bifidobacteriaceae bacterium]|nr:hypothetical protein [Bifidobacteriaceae bacterium]
AARSLGLAIVAGGFSPAEAAPDPAAGGAGSGLGAVPPAGGASAEAGFDPRPFNVLLAVDADGRQVARQAKTRLYDAFSYRESALARPGPIDAPAPVELGGVLFGLINCYELRFPEHARRLMRAGAEAFALSAAWVRGPFKEDHWVTLARARAIENCAYVLAAGARGGDTIGRSMVVDPTGVVLAGLADQPEGLAFASLEPARVAEARARALP